MKTYFILERKLRYIGSNSRTSDHPKRGNVLCIKQIHLAFKRLIYDNDDVLS